MESYVEAWESDVCVGKELLPSHVLDVLLMPSSARPLAAIHQQFIVYRS